MHVCARVYTMSLYFERIFTIINSYTCNNFINIRSSVTTHVIMWLTPHSELVTVTRNISILLSRSFAGINFLLSAILTQISLSGYASIVIWMLRHVLKFKIIRSINFGEKYNNNNNNVQNLFAKRFYVVLRDLIHRLFALFRFATVNRGTHPFARSLARAHTRTQHLPHNCILHCHQILIGNQNLLYFLHTKFKIKKNEE